MRLTHVPIVRLTHIVLLYNQSDGLRLSEQFSLVICYFKTIFIAYNYCNATLRCPAAIYYAALSLSLALYNIVLLVPSSAPHIKVIFLRSTSLGGHVILFASFMDMEVTKKKN